MPLALRRMKCSRRAAFQIAVKSSNDISCNGLGGWVFLLMARSVHRLRRNVKMQFLKLVLDKRNGIGYYSACRTWAGARQCQHCRPHDPDEQPNRSKKHWVFIPRGRIEYEGQDAPGARFPSALIGIGVEPPKGIEGCLLREIAS